MYTEEQLGLSNYMAVAADADDLTGAAVHTTSVGVMAQVKVKRLMCLVSTAVVSTGAVVVAFKRYPTFGSAAGAVTLGSVSIPAGTAAGKVVYKDISQVTLLPGDQLVAEVTTAAAGGGAAGGALYGVLAELDPEQPANQSDMIASA